MSNMNNGNLGLPAEPNHPEVKIDLSGNLLPAIFEYPPIPRPGTIPHRSADPRQLSEADIAQLGRSLFPIYMSGFMHDGDKSPQQQHKFFEDLLKHIGSTERLTLLECPEGEVHGFICASIVAVPLGRLYHLEGIVLDQHLQGRGIGYAMLHSELKQCNADVMAFHTQSSRMYRLGQRLADLTPEVADRVAGTISHRRLVGAIDKERYGNEPLYGDLERLRRIAMQGVDVEKGDAVFAAGYVKGRMQ